MFGGNELVEYTCNGQLAAMEKLLKDQPGYDVNSTDSEGFTAAIAAAKINDMKMLKFLKDNGADLSITDNLDQGPLFWANRNSNHVMAEYIKSATRESSKGIV